MLQQQHNQKSGELAAGVGEGGAGQAAGAGGGRSTSVLVRRGRTQKMIVVHSTKIHKFYSKNTTNRRTFLNLRYANTMVK